MSNPTYPSTLTRRILPTLQLGLVVAALLVGSLPAHASEDTQTTEVTTTAEAPDPNKIIVVEIVGTKRVEKETALLGVKSRKGTILNPEVITEDLRLMWKKGFFRDITIEKEATEAGWKIHITVKEKPAIRAIKYVGNDDLSEDDIKEVIDVKPYTILNVEQLKANVQKIKDLYLDKGFYLADVDYRIELVPENDQIVDVYFDVNEKAKVVVKQIAFIGNNQLKDAEVKAVLQTREGNELSFMSKSGTYKEEHFQTDLMRIQALYYDHGFVGVKVGTPTATISPDLKSIYLSVPVEEGLKYSVGKISFSGDVVLENKGRKVLDAERLTNRMRVEKGDVFSRTKLFEDIQRLTGFYRNYGYAYANVTPNSTMNPDSQTVDLDLVVQRGDLVYIGRIDIVGNTRTRDKVIRREFRVYEGELYSEIGVEASKARVFQLGFFENVEIKTSSGSKPNTMNVSVEVQEKSTGTFQVGAGFSSVESFIATAQISQNNFLGNGQSLSLSAQLSFGDFARQMATLQFYEPYFLDSYWSLGLNAYITQHYYRDFQRNATGLSPSLGYPITPDLRLTVGYTLEQIEISTEMVGNSSRPALHNLNRDGRSSSITATLSYDTRDNRLFPTRGQYYVLTGEVSNKAIGSEEDMQFNRTGMTLRYYYPLVWKFVLKMNAEIGYVFGGGVHGIPVSERFFPGGIYSVRGFAPRALGPTQSAVSEGNPTSPANPFTMGGNKQTVFNLEIEFPILEGAGIKGVLFVDAGNAFDDDETLFYLGMNDYEKPDVYLMTNQEIQKPPLGLYWAFGFGFRWFSPIGPLRFEWGIPITKRAPQDDDILFEFTIGNFF